MNAGLHDEQSISVLILIERLCNQSINLGINLQINSLTIHRLILASVLITSKFNNDVYYSNSHLAAHGGVSTSEINLLESFFMQAINWNVNVKEDEYLRYL
mmetsp:Transcript_23120/g.16445  ORF Transcript_23120/g.16445 Transcript_23120/m.16445 type:complete len:101 (+) Transcript_23120:257-559(+)